MVINMEFNQLNPFLRATGYIDGDVNCEICFSPFPGNMNQMKYGNYTLSFMEHHRPAMPETKECLVPPSDGYKSPIRWPKEEMPVCIGNDKEHEETSMYTEEELYE